MCSNLKLSKSKHIKPADSSVYRFYTGSSIGSKLGLFGFNRGIYYNAQSENMYTKWRNYSYNRGYLEIVGFYEKGYEFSLKDDEPMFVAILFNEKNEFCLLTENSEGPVAEVHNRMPVIIGNDPLLRDKWLKEGKIIHLNPNLLISKKTA